MYSYIKDNEKGGRTAKGIKKNIIKNNIRHEDYKNKNDINLVAMKRTKYHSAVSMTSATSMIMEQAVMPMGIIK